jgi:TRAP-type C4-dicarboxylate transport system permease small subunit
MSEGTPVASYPVIRRVDELWHRGERLVCGVMFVFMALMVFASVIAETFGNRREWIDVVVLYGVCLLGVRTREVKDGERKLDWPMAAGVALGVTAVIAGAVWVYVERYPGGFIWAQKLALVMMVWVALLGASMATYERSHLALEMGEKIWPKNVLRYVRALAHLVTSAFCIFALYGSWKLVQAQQDEATAIIGADWLPSWVAFLAMPYAFAAMSVRFLAQMVTVVTNTEAPIEERMPS